MNNAPAHVPTQTDRIEDLLETIRTLKAKLYLHCPESDARKLALSKLETLVTWTVDAAKAPDRCMDPSGPPPL